MSGAPPLRRPAATSTVERLRAELAHLERRRRHAVELEALCERKRRGHEETVRQLDLAIEALEVELGD